MNKDESMEKKPFLCSIGLHKWRYDFVREVNQFVMYAEERREFCRTCLRCGEHQANPHNGEVACNGNYYLEYPLQKDMFCSDYEEICRDLITARNQEQLKEIKKKRKERERRKKEQKNCKFFTHSNNEVK